MTIVTATVAPTIGVLSADTLVYSIKDVGPCNHAPLDASPESFVRATWCGDGTTPSVQPLGYMPKVYAVPHLKMAVAAGGVVMFGPAWADILGQTPFTDITELTAFEVSSGLDELARQAGSYAPTVIYHVGWSDREQRMVGFICCSETGFQPEPFTGHQFGVIPYPHSPDHRDLLRTGDRAAQGHDVEAFHTAVARNVDNAYRGGRAWNYLHFGGELLAATVTPKGVTMSRLHTFGPAG